MKKQYYTTDNGFEKAESTFRSAGKVIKNLCILAIIILATYKIYKELAQILHPFVLIIIGLVCFLLMLIALIVYNSKTATDEQSDIESHNEQCEILKRELYEQKKRKQC